MPFHISEDEFGELVTEALADLPPEIAALVEEVPIEVRERPSPAQLQRARVGSGSLLLGLYVGRPRTQRNVEDSGAMPDVIYIFKHNIELISGSRTQLVGQVRKTVLHEIGHHFGLGEEDLDALGYG
jgi:predicted Zn-dependent protease with MMP-like domain